MLDHHLYLPVVLANGVTQESYLGEQGIECVAQFGGDDARRARDEGGAGQRSEAVSGGECGPTSRTIRIGWRPERWLTRAGSPVFRVPRWTMSPLPSTTHIAPADH